MKQLNNDILYRYVTNTCTEDEREKVHNYLMEDFGHCMTIARLMGKRAYCDVAGMEENSVELFKDMQAEPMIEAAEMTKGAIADASSDTGFTSFICGSAPSWGHVFRREKKISQTSHTATEFIQKLYEYVKEE